MRARCGRSQSPFPEQAPTDGQMRHDGPGWPEPDAFFGFHEPCRAPPPAISESFRLTLCEGRPDHSSSTFSKVRCVMICPKTLGLVWLFW